MKNKSKLKKTISSKTAYDIKMAAEDAGTTAGQHYAYNAQAGEKDDSRSHFKHMGSFDVMSGVEGYGVSHSVRSASKVLKHSTPIMQKQGYYDREDESIAMRKRKHRTKKQLQDSRDESYGDWGERSTDWT
jgi:hypothetical protein